METDFQHRFESLNLATGWINYYLPEDDEVLYTVFFHDFTNPVFWEMNPPRQEEARSASN